MRIAPSPGLSNKVATGIDIAATLAVEQVGVTLHISAWHPMIFGTVVGLTWVLFKYKDEITDVFIDTLQPIQNKNHYSFQGDEPVTIYNRRKQEMKMSRSASKKPFKPVLYV
jgi:hypothetical protein